MRALGGSIVILVLAMGGCLLADNPEPPTCEKGFHPELGRCRQDESTEKRVVITPPEGGTSCSGDAASQRAPVLTPDPFEVKAGEQFQFQNNDVTAPEIRGTD